jgi:single-strand DNA-binding protein
MSNLKNKVQLMGFVGKDPEVKHLSTGTTMARFSMATNDHYTNAKGEKVEETYWHNIVAWGKQAEFVEKYVSKGIELAIEGKLVSRSYENKDGNKVYITEIVTHEVLLLTKKNHEISKSPEPLAKEKYK